MIIQDRCCVEAQIPRELLSAPFLRGRLVVAVQKVRWHKGAFASVHDDDDGDGKLPFSRQTDDAVGSLLALFANKRQWASPSPFWMG